jgi:glycerol-3-phosphate cytidylyltransferase
MLESKLKRAYIGGTFDLLHYGHIQLFKNAKEYFKEIVVSLNTDEFSLRYKKILPHYSLEQRILMVSSCQYVDTVIINEGCEDSKPAILACKATHIIHGDDWTDNSLMTQMGLTKKFMEENNIKFFYLPYTKGISSTFIRTTLEPLPVQLVIGRYKESYEQMKWIENIGIPTIIYTKTNIPFFISNPNIKIIHIPFEENGREALTYLNHIIDNYNSLADFTLFAQAKIDDHCKDIKTKTNFTRDFTWLADSYLYTKNDGTPHNFPEIAKVYKDLFNENMPEKVYFGFGTMFMASKEIIKQRPISYYKAIIEYFNNLPQNTQRTNGEPATWWYSYTERFFEKIITGTCTKDFLTYDSYAKFR